MQIFEIQYFICFYIFGIENLFFLCECERVDEQTVENGVEVDLQESEKYELIEKSPIVSLVFVQPNKIRFSYSYHNLNDWKFY